MKILSLIVGRDDGVVMPYYGIEYEDKLDEIDRLMAIKEVAMRNIDLGDTKQFGAHMGSVSV